MRAPALRTWLVCGVPVLLFGVLYAPRLDYGFVWTDAGEIQGGSILRPPGHWLEAFAQPLQRSDDFHVKYLLQPYYRPLQVVTASWLDAAFGREPRTFRAASLLLGSATVALFAALASELGASPGAALVAAAIVAAHPLGLETWVWISGLSAALAAFFLVASLWLALRALRAPRGAARISLGAASVAAFALGLLSKESAAVAPALLVAAALGLTARARHGEGPPLASGRRLAASVGALAGAELAIALVVFLGVRPRVLGSALSATPALGGSTTTQLASALAHWPAALAWLFLPLHSNTSDAVRVVTSPLDPLALAGAALALGSLAAWLLLAWRGHGLAATALAWIWIGFAPTSGVVPLLHLGAERNLCFALLGAALLWTSAGPGLRRLGAPPALVAALAVLLVAGLAQRTWARAPDWRSTVTLFERDVAADPHHREGRFDLALAYLESGRVAEAKREADVLLAQRAGAGTWSSYLLDERVLTLHCLASERSGDDADVLAVWDAETGGSTPRVYQMPSYHECAARALERAGRFRDALGIWQQLHRMADAAVAPAYALAVARCRAELGEVAEARQWLARVPRVSALEPEIRRVRRLIRTQRARAPRS